VGVRKLFWVNNPSDLSFIITSFTHSKIPNLTLKTWIISHRIGIIYYQLFVIDFHVRYFIHQMFGMSCNRHYTITTPFTFISDFMINHTCHVISMIYRRVFNQNQWFYHWYCIGFFHARANKAMISMIEYNTMLLHWSLNISFPQRITLRSRPFIQRIRTTTKGCDYNQFFPKHIYFAGKE